MRTAHQINPGANAHLLARLHHLQRLVQQDFSRQGIIDHLDYPIGQGKAPPGGVFLHAYPAAEGQLDDDASSQRVGDILVPERQVALETGM